MAGSGSRKTAEDIKNIDMMTVRNKTQQEVTDVIFPNGLTVGLNDPRFNNGMRINGNMQCNGAVNATGPNASFRINGVPLPTEAIKGDQGVSVKGATGSSGDKGEPGEKGIPGVSTKGEPGTNGTDGDKGEPGISVKGAVGGKGEPGLNATGTKGEPGGKGEPGVDGYLDGGLSGYSNPAIITYDEDGLNPSPSGGTVYFRLSESRQFTSGPALKITASTGILDDGNDANYTDSDLNRFVDTGGAAPGTYVFQSDVRVYWKRDEAWTSPNSYPGPNITVTAKSANDDGNETQLNEHIVTIACIKNGEKGAKGSSVKGQKGATGASSSTQKTTISGYSTSDDVTDQIGSNQNSNSQTLTFQKSNAAASFYIQELTDISSNFTLNGSTASPSTDITVNNNGVYSISASLSVKAANGGSQWIGQLELLVDNGNGSFSVLSKTPSIVIPRNYVWTMTTSGVQTFSAGSGMRIGLRTLCNTSNGNALYIAAGGGDALTIAIEKLD